MSGGMGFGEAIEALNTGSRVARAGWNGKGMFLFLVVDCQLLPMSNSEQVAEACALPKSPFIAMKTADGHVVPWLASQTDVLATDWCDVR